MKRTTFLASLTAAILTGVLVSGAQAQTALKFSHTDQPGGLRQDAAELFGKKIQEYTQGRYRLQVYPAGQLGNDMKGVEQLQLGGIDFTVTGIGNYANILPSLNLMLMPYLFDTYQQGWKFYDESPWFQDQLAKAPAKGLRILSHFEAGFRSMTTRTAVNTPADAKGVKLRTYSNEMQRWLLEAMGFGIQILPLPEVYLAIQQGVVQGQENPIDTIHANKFYEVAPYVSLTKHVYSPIPLSISEKTWQKFSPADREAITRAAKEAADWSRKQVAAAEDSQLADMASKGAKILHPNIELFRAAVKSAYERAREKYGAADTDKVLAEAEAIRKALPAK
jgi:TRAP-type transport system periplasmic protein